MIKERSAARPYKSRVFCYDVLPEGQLPNPSFEDVRFIKGFRAKVSHILYTFCYYSVYPLIALNSKLSKLEERAFAAELNQRDREWVENGCKTHKWIFDDR